MLKESEILSYWDRRSAKQGERTVGYSNSPMEVQDERYRVRTAFIMPHMDRRLATLEYGCGTGRYASQFDDYLGVDITERLLGFAKRSHPDKRFELLRHPWIDDLPEWNFEVFFTATVLQHNNDAMVDKILGSVASHKTGGFQFVLYENNHRNARHVAARSPERYLDLVRVQFPGAIMKNTDSHIIHGERHCLAIIDV